jgi:hypothetical protein
MAVAKVLSAGLSPQNPMFDPRPARLGFVVDKAALGQDYIRVIRFSLVSVIPPGPHNHVGVP